MSITLEMKSHLYLLINRPMVKASCRRLAYFRKNNTLRFFIIKNLHIPSILDQTDSILFQSVSSLFKKFENYSFSLNVSSNKFMCCRRGIWLPTLTVLGRRDRANSSNAPESSWRKGWSTFCSGGLKECIAHGTDTINFLSGINWYPSFWLAVEVALRANMILSNGCLPLGPSHAHINFPERVIWIWFNRYYCSKFEYSTMEEHLLWSRTKWRRSLNSMKVVEYL